MSSVMKRSSWICSFLAFMLRISKAPKKHGGDMPRSQEIIYYKPLSHFTDRP